MKDLFAAKEVNRTAAVFLAITLSLIAGQTALSQTAQAGMAVTSNAPDVSVYPRNPDSLPGKGPAQTWADFPRIWSQRHGEWAKTRDQDRAAVVFFGDSITQGWTSLAKDFPNLKVANRGIGGDTTRGLLYRLDYDVLSLEPVAVVLLIGTNDIGLGADPADVADNIESLLRSIKRVNARTPVVVCKVMPSSETKQRPADKIKRVNELISSVAAHYPECSVCDTWSIYADQDGDSKAAEFPDRLHPNAIGYAKWAGALKPIFARLNLGSNGQR
jgi:lysophospholipase L1-like esterase